MAISSLLGAVGAVALGCFLYKYLVYPMFFSPLAKAPCAHWSAAFSPLWMLWIRFKLRENRTIWNAHQQLGPVVRLGPNELSVNDYHGGLKTIYVGGFEKIQWYANMFENYGDVPTMFSTEHSKPHSHRKRLLTHLYSKSTLQSSPTMRAISNRIIFQRFLPKFVQAEGGPVDVLFLINCVAMDFVTAYLFGMCNGTNFLRDEDLARHWLHCFHSRRPFVFWTGELPAIISWCNLLGPANPLSTPFVVEANRWLGDHCLRMVDDVLDTQPDATAELAHPENIPVVTRHLHSSLRRQADKSDAIPLTGSQHSIRMQVASEVLDHLMAGFETTGITLTYLFWELAQRPTLQRKLRDELRGIFSPLYTSFDSDAAKLPDSKTIDSLPLLHAILMETLRLHPAIPGPEPRMTPPDATVGGIPHLPAGVRVSCSAYSLHKNPDVFPDPLEFRPDRWISAAADGAAGKERMAEQHRWFWAFSSGGRMCIGSNLAVQEMKLLVASIVSGWRAEMVNDEGIEQEDAYTAQPTSKKLLLKFARW